ncbi:hypothetical protein VNO80_26995 [Phaseolus coccineus]|uniref:Uncharacterized protein n=1 Tax=Phaseolus coccineus TaxID=3886 RepID=A0AAN9LJH7_PHACN
MCQDSAGITVVLFAINGKDYDVIWYGVWTNLGYVSSSVGTHGMLGCILNKYTYSLRQLMLQTSDDEPCGDLVDLSSDSEIV